MKLKYYLRGLGMGILFATIVMAIAFSSRLTDKEVEKRARDMGMVYGEETSRKLVKAEENTESSSSGNDEQTQDKQNQSDSAKDDSSDKENTKNSDKKDENNKTSKQSEDKTTKETTSKKETTTQKEETKAATKKETTKAKEKKPTKKEEETTKKPEEKKTFQISSGMSSNMLAENLANLGIVESARDFNSYLEANGYANKLVVGDYSISGSVSYETLAKLVTN